MERMRQLQAKRQHCLSLTSKFVPGDRIREIVAGPTVRNGTEVGGGCQST